MAKFSEQKSEVLHIVQLATRSTLGVYDSRPLLARYALQGTLALLAVLCPRSPTVLSTLNVTRVRKHTRSSVFFRAAESGARPGNKASLAPDKWLLKVIKV